MNTEEVRPIVEAVYKRYGKELFLDKVRLKSFLADYLAMYPLEYRLLSNAAECGICFKLIHGEDTDSDLKYYAQLLSDSYGTDVKQSQETIKVLQYAINGKEAKFIPGETSTGTSRNNHNTGNGNVRMAKKRAHSSPWSAVRRSFVVALFFILFLHIFVSKEEGTNASNEIAATTPYTTVQPAYVQNAWLTHLPPIEQEKYIRTAYGKTNIGENISNGIYSDAPYGTVTYNLNGQYDYLSAKWVITSEGKNTNMNHSFDVYADNVMIFSSPSITAGSIPVDININLGSCNILTIMFKEADDCSALTDIYLYNTEEKLIPTTQYTPELLPCWLTDLEPLTEGHYIDVDSNNYNNNRANTGESIAHCIGSKYDDYAVEYYLQGKYSRFTGSWLLTEDGKNCNKPLYFQIYADDVLIFTSPQISSGSLPIPFDLPIYNCQKLKLYFPVGDCDEIQRTSAYAANLRLYP